MLLAQSIESFINVVALIGIYIISTIISGTAFAWILSYCGDSTAEDAGFLSLDPFVYVDPFGVLSLFLIGCGWGKPVPRQLNFIQEPYRQLKMIAIYLTRPVVAALLALVGFVISMLLMGPQGLYIAYEYTCTRGMSTVSLHDIQLYSPGISSAALVGVVFAFQAIALNLFLGAWNICFDICYHILYVGIRNEYEYAEHTDLILLAGPLFLFFTCGRYIYACFLWLLAKIILICCALLGIL